MENLSKLGRLFFAIAIASFGLQFLVHVFFAGPVPGPPWSPGRPIWAYLTIAVLLIAAVCIATGKNSRPAAMLLAILLGLRAFIVFAPRIVANVYDPGPWTSGSEILALCGVALVLTGSLAGLGRLLFALPLLVFGAQHFLYARFVATLVPSWIPFRLFWSVFVGVAFVAAALSIATRIRLRLSATLLGLMFLL